MYNLVNDKFKEFSENLPVNLLKDIDLNTINVKDIHTTRILLKSRKEIDSTQYSMLGDLKNKIEDYQKYKYSPDLNYISEILDSYIKYSTGSTNTIDFFPKMISRLSLTSKESVVNSNKFSEFNKYIHVKRNIEDQLLDECHKLCRNQTGIILLVGSVGDGKSHLLSFLKSNHPHLFKDIHIHNDATESNSPNQTAVETLTELLSKHYKEQTKLVIAVNIGMLHKFMTHLQNTNKFYEFQKFVRKSKIFKDEFVSSKELNTTYNATDNNYSIVSFLEEQTLTIKDGVVENHFYSELIKKVFLQVDENPIYKAFIEDDGLNRDEPIYLNYKILLNEKVQQSLLFMLNLIRIQDKRILTARSVLNLIYDIISPNEDFNNKYTTLLTTLIFENEEKSKLLESIGMHDPSQQLKSELENLNVRIYNTNHLPMVCSELFKNDYKHVQEIILYLSNLDRIRNDKKYKTIVRLYFLFNHEKFISNDYSNYLKLISDIQSNNKSSQKSFLKQVESCIYKWNGSPEQGYIFKNIWNSKDLIRIGIEFRCRFKAIYIYQNSIYVEVYDENNFSSPQKIYTLEIDYPLYLLICKISNGYVVKSSDRNDSINFNEFIDEIVENTVSMRNTIIKINSSNRLFKISSGVLSPEIEEL